MEHVNKCERYNSVALSIFMMLCNHHVSNALLTPQGKLPPKASSALAPPPGLPAPSAFCLWMCLFWAFLLKGILPSVPFVTGSTHNFLSCSKNIVKGGFVLLSAIKGLHSLPQRENNHKNGCTGNKFTVNLLTLANLCRAPA